MTTTHEYDLSCQHAPRTNTLGRTLLLLGFFLCGTTLSPALYAQVPQLINFQAQLADDGTLLSPTTIVFSIYDAASGGTQLWTEQHSVTHTDGIFNVLLGSTAAFPATLFTDDGERYLDMFVGGEFLAERFRLSSVAYALRAEAADKTGPAGITFPDGTVQVSAATSSGGGSFTLPFSGTASTSGAAFSAANNGSGDALSVPSSGGDGLQVTAATGRGVYVQSSGGNALEVNGSGADGLNIGSTTNDGVYILSAGADGVEVQNAGDDGVYVAKAGDIATIAPDEKHNGVEVAGAEGDGLFVGNTGGDGVRVKSAGGDGVHVEAAGGLAGYFGGDVEATGTVEAATLESTTGGVRFPDGTVQTTAASGGGGGDGDWTISGDNLISGVSGNVGIGTSSPSARLDVSGSAVISGSIGVGTSTPVAPMQVAGTDGSFRVHPIFGGLNGTTLLGAWVGDTAFPQVRFGKVDVPDFIDIGQDGNGDFVIESNDVSRFVVGIGGNVGIGTTSVDAKLKVIGRVYVAGNENTIGQQFAPTIDLSVDDNDSGLDVPADGNLALFTNNVERVRINQSGNVGIGTAAPEAELDVKGKVLANSLEAGDTPSAISARRADGTAFFAVNSDVTIMDNTVMIGGFAGSERVNVLGEGQGIELGAGVAGKQTDAGKITYKKFSDGLELIGAGTEPNGLDRKIQMWAEGGLTLIGSMTATGSITPGSSRAFKKDIADLTLEEALAALADLNPVKYRYKDEENNDLHLGFIAEDVPELVSIPRRNGVDPSDIVALLTKVVQQQQRQIAALEARLNR